MINPGAVVRLKVDFRDASDNLMVHAGSVFKWQDQSYQRINGYDCVVNFEDVEIVNVPDTIDTDDPISDSYYLGEFNFIPPIKNKKKPVRVVVDSKNRGLFRVVGSKDLQCDFDIKRKLMTAGWKIKDDGDDYVVSFPDVSEESLKACAHQVQLFYLQFEMFN